MIQEVTLEECQKMILNVKSPTWDIEFMIRYEDEKLRISTAESTFCIYPKAENSIEIELKG